MLCDQCSYLFINTLYKSRVVVITVLYIMFSFGVNGKLNLDQNQDDDG
jgi:hypothetical protein